MNDARDATAPLRPPSWQIAAVGGLFLGIAVLLLFNFWRLGRPIALPNAEHDKLECASYTPSHDGHVLSVVEKRRLITDDLKLLAERFRCVRTYSVSEGLDDVPRVARELGLKVMLGLWISSHGPSNDAEVARGVELANQYADVVTSVVVGNEVLLRRELTAGQLRALMERVRAQTQVPVTYADVWEFWLRNAELATVASFITIHILPYWEDNPIGIDHALDHVQSIYRKVEKAFPHKRVLIGETGWPSAGRPRLKAVPSVINEARFVREFVAFAEREKIPYNLIEAFDQPWKRIQEGTVGGYWGLYRADRSAKFSFTGTVVANEYWRSALLIALIGAFVFATTTWMLRPRPSARAIALAGIAGHVAGSVVFLQWNYLMAANRTTLEWTATAAWASIGWSAYLLIVLALARWLDGTPLSHPMGVTRIAHALGHGAKKTHGLSANVLGLLRFFFLFGAAYVSLSLAYDGRGRDFPIASIGLPVIAFALLELLASRATERSSSKEETLLAMVVALTTMFTAWHETAANTRAMVWCALCLLLAATIGFEQFRTRRLNPNQRAEQKTDAA